MWLTKEKKKELEPNRAAVVPTRGPDVAALEDRTRVRYVVAQRGETRVRRPLAALLSPPRQPRWQTILTMDGGATHCTKQHPERSASRPKIGRLQRPVCAEEAETPVFISGGRVGRRRRRPAGRRREKSRRGRGGRRGPRHADPGRGHRRGGPPRPRKTRSTRRRRCASRTSSAAARAGREARGPGRSSSRCSAARLAWCRPSRHSARAPPSSAGTF
mmetsp:Transcript_14588/g.36899  ORF Transcript_14588/g.36899 Transcript_14588/m.36899 type:complete len:217 (+) Transcript_14588:45-695(+)